MLGGFFFIMTLPEIFETLLTDQKITLYVGEKRAADSLRVSLLRKFKDYKTQMEQLGFLPQHLESAVVSLEWQEDGGVARFFLREKIRKLVEYTIVKDTMEASDNEHT